MDSDFEKTLEILREAHREAIPEAHYAAVRARVLAQLGTERRPWWRGIWAHGFASAAVVAMLLAAFWPKHGVEPRPGVAVAARPLPDGRGSDVGVPSGGVHIRAARVSKRSAAVRIHRVHSAAPAPYPVIGPPTPKPPLVVKLVTNDPNVVIYWISGE